MKRRILALASILALVAALAVPMAALATTEVTGTQPATAELTAPSAIGIGSFTTGANTGNSGTPGQVVANTAGWTLSVEDNNQAADTGKMLTGATPLTSALGVGINATAADGGAFTAYQTGLQGSTGYGTVTTFSIPLYVNQPVVASDAPGAYSLTVKYTATPA